MAIKIMLDAGHYGLYNRSPVVPEYWESQAMWKLHFMLKAELEKYGFEVSETRTEQEVDLEVTRRGRLAKDYNLLISLHSNAASTESVDRPVGIYQVQQENSTIAKASMEVAELLAKTVATVMDTNDPPKQYERLSSSDRNKDGVLNDNYYGILHGAWMVETAAVILEHSFHTNKRAAKWLLDDDNLQKLAVAEAEALANYFSIKKPARRKGDVNGDGKIDARDYNLALRIFLGTYIPSAEEFWAADIDDDGAVTSKDAYKIKRHFLGTYKIPE